MGVRLPSAYQETEYIESTGAQWIDTGIVHGKFVHDIAFTANGRQLMGCHSTSSKFWGSSGKKAYYELHASKINTDTDKRNIVIYDNTNDPTTSLTAAGVTKTATITGPNPLPSYVLFRINNENYYASARLYHISIYDIADDLIYDGIPCYRKSDSVAGLYDLVGRTFYPNQGTGSFLVGPDVIDSISPMMVAWRRMLMRKPSPVPTGYVTDGLVLWLDGINKGNTPNAWDDLISGYSFEDYYGQVVFGSDYVEFADNKECYLYNQDFDVPRYTDGTIEIVYETNIAHAQILFSPKSKLSIAYGVGAGSVIWVKNVGSGTRPNMYKYPRFTSGSVSISLNSAYYDGAVQQNTGIDIWADDDRASTVIGKTYYRDDRCFGGKIYCIRIYNRQLTEAEVLANYAVDRSRFSLFN